MSTDLSDKSNEFRHGYLSCVEDMRGWFLSEQRQFAHEKQRMKAHLEKQRHRLSRQYGYQAGVDAVLSLPLRQIAEFKRHYRTEARVTSHLIKALRLVHKDRERSNTKAGI